MTKLIRQFKKYLANGFNVIEILIMISLLAVTFVAILSMIIKSIQMEHITKNDLVAVALAKEGIELVEEIRNINIQSNDNFYEHIIECRDVDPGPIVPCEQEHSGTNFSFFLDYINGLGGLIIAPDGDVTLTPPLYFDDTNYYQYSGMTIPPIESRFKRMMTTTYFNQGGREYLRVVTEVYWEYQGKGFSYYLTTHLFDD